MKRANGVLTEGKLGSFPSFSLGLLEVASERRAVPICPGPDAASQAPSSPLGSLCVSRDSPSRPTRPIQGLQGPSRVQPWTLHRTSHPRVPGGLRTDRGLIRGIARAPRGPTLRFPGRERPHNSFQLLPDLCTGCIFQRPPGTTKTVAFSPTAPPRGYLAFVCVSA